MIEAAGEIVVNEGDIEVPGFIRTALANPRRPPEDQHRDEVRRIGQLMTFFDIRPGLKVADLMASRGYVAGVLAEIVGPEGVVFAQNSPRLLARFKGDNPIVRRIREGGFTNLVNVVCELEDLKLPTGKLDAVFSFMFYHDTVWVGTDRPAMIAAVYRSLKPGGIFAVVDHHAPSGTGVSLAESHHRIERAIVVEEVMAQGFEIADESDVLANPDDPLDVLVFDKAVREKTHKFALKFRRPVTQRIVS